LIYSFYIVVDFYLVINLLGFTPFFEGFDFSGLEEGNVGWQLEFREGARWDRGELLPAGGANDVRHTRSGATEQLSSQVGQV
jgi:hypothetical protein